MKRPDDKKRASEKPGAQGVRPQSERIAKAMARAGLCSRREAESWILAGRVSVNGQKITSPALNVTPADRIEVDGAAMPERERTRLFLYHKPRGLVTTNADPEGRPTIFGALPKGLPRLISVGRLDMNTEGLLLLTNDGGLARVLELPETGWLRRYRVRALGKLTQAQLDPLRKGITIDGIRYGEIEATLDREQGHNVWLTFAIREGKNREVRNVLEHLGLQVNRLIRLSYGPFQLGDLTPGAVEEVRTRHLREQLGERIAAQSGADFSGPMNVRPESKDDAANAGESRPRNTGRPRQNPQEREPPDRKRAATDRFDRQRFARKASDRPLTGRVNDKRAAKPFEKRGERKPQFADRPSSERKFPERPDRSAAGKDTREGRKPRDRNPNELDYSDQKLRYRVKPEHREQASQEHASRRPSGRRPFARPKKKRTPFRRPQR